MHYLFLGGARWWPGWAAIVAPRFGMKYRLNMNPRFLRTRWLPISTRVAQWAHGGGRGYHHVMRWGRRLRRGQRRQR